MDRPTNTRLVFSDQLRLETERVLEGPVFGRSPVQSQLLRYLLERTLEGGAAPTQYEIAVDGLGKDSDFDLASDSYPRVQMSRLRSNLDGYYSRQAPGNGLRLIVEAGEYRLGLEKVDLAESPAPIASVSTSFPIEQAGDVAPLEVGKSEALSHAAGVGLLFREERGGMVLWLLAAIALLLGLLVYTNFLSPTADAGLANNGGPIDKPSIRLIIDTEAIPAQDQAALDRVQIAARLVEVQLAYSWVSRPTVADSEEDNEYTLALDFARSARPLRAFVELSDRNGAVLFRDRIVDNPASPGLFPQELAAAIVYITSPTGVIATDQLAMAGQEPRNGYECFLKIENSRADGERTASLVDSCVERFPTSEYQPFFLARRAFTGFQQRIIEGKPMERRGQAWEDLQTALDLDRFNAFANFTAAKVELANDNCDGASGFIRNAFERAISYPAMVVAIEAAATSCPTLSTTNGAILESVVRTNSAPDPLLYLYLLIGLIGADKMTEAEALAQRLPVTDPSGMEQETIALLQRSIADPDYARANAPRLRKDIGLFVWGGTGAEKVVEALTRPETPTD
ncbi:MAG: hypothetical protein AAF291_05155 [Pseudomonadota bacterium]